MEQQPDLFSAPPVNGIGPSLQASKSGALSVSEIWGERQLQYLALLGTYGSVSDKTAAKLLKIDLGSVCSTRNAVKDLLETDGCDEQPCGRRMTKRTRWKLKR